MPQIINTNIMSLNAQRNLNRSQDAMATALQRLSSGMRINSAKDDAAGLAISERFTAQIRGLNQAARNAADGISLAQTAEGAMGEIANNLQRIRELAVQSANATNSSSDRTSLNNEVLAIQAEMKRISSSTTFNGVAVLGTSQALSFQVGANAGTTANQVNVTTVKLSNLGSGIGSAYLVTITSVAKALSAISAVDNAINLLATVRAKFGTTQNRFESIVRSAQTTSENLQASRSRIMDADFAKETAELTRTQILQQAGTAMLAQANSLPQNVLSLLR